MNANIFNHFAFLYGESSAALLASELAEIAAARGFHPTGTPAAELTERDAILITYGDQLSDPPARPLRTLEGFLTTHVSDRISAVHLLPFYPSSSDDGFSVMDYFAVDPAVGNWDDIDALCRRFELMFDAVFNHASARGVWFRRFLDQEPGWESAFVIVEDDPDLSQVVRPRALPLLTSFETAAGPRRLWTTFSADQVDLNVKDPRILLALLDVLLFYVARGARFIRLDAIGFLWKEIGTSCLHLPQTHAIIRLMRSLLDAVAPHVVLITETNVPHQDNISYFGDGTNEAQLVYNFALPPLVLHTLRTGNATRLTDWAHALTLPSDRVSFFNFLASHDGIGLNPARGILNDQEVDALVAGALDHGGFVSYKYDTAGNKVPYELNINFFDALSNPQGNELPDLQIRRFIAAHAIMLSLRGVPGIYFHSLFGSRSDRAGAVASGIPRRINRQKLHRQPLEGELRHPQSFRRRILDALLDLLSRRQRHPAFHPMGRQEILSLGPSLFALRRDHSGDACQCLVNVTNAPVDAGTPLGKRVLGPYEVLWESAPSR